MKKLLFLIIVTISQSVTAAELNREAVKGLYHLGTAERGKNQVNIDFGQLGNKVVLAIACQGCPPATYSFLQEESKTLGVATFTTAGLYVFRFDDESFIIVQPDAVLGRKVWSKIGYANIYSKNKAKANATSTDAIQKFAIDLSARIMHQEVGSMAHAAGTYYLAVPQDHLGRAQSQYDITFSNEGKKQIHIKPCDNCGIEEYEQLPEESAIAGVDVYRHASSYYLFDLQDGVLIYTFANASGLGKDVWGKNNHYNVYSNNQAYIRQILASKEKQDIIDKMMAEFFMSIKTEFEKRADEANQEKIANRTLPAQGLIDETQNKLALDASNRWANAWQWKESIKNAYFLNSDWSITRNKLTGVITGKVIGGFITMVHPDGRCRFQYVNYRQDFDGSQYMNFHMTGVGPVYDLKCENMQ